MAYTGINLENVKANNRSAILKLLNEQGTMSRKDLAAALGLTPATVTLICSELIASGILCEEGELKESKRVGRKKILVGINYTCRYVLSISIEAIDTRITISDLKGEHRSTRTLKTDSQLPPEEFLRLVAFEGIILMQEANVSREMILGVGVSLPGTVDRQTGLSKLAYRIWDHPVNVYDCLRHYFDSPIIVENNVKAFAEAELIYGSGKKNENLLFLKWGPGVGSALVIHNQIYESRISKEGELGHITVEKGGKLCRCGRRGCLETKASIHSIAEQVSANCSPQTMPHLYERIAGDLSQIRARNIDWWFQPEDPGLWTVMDDIIEQTANITAHSITLLAPDAVILYGQVFQLPQVKDHFLNFCKQYDPAYNDSYIYMSQLSDRIDYIGPLAVIVNKLFFSTGGMLAQN